MLTFSQTEYPMCAVILLRRRRCFLFYRSIALVARAIFGSKNDAGFGWGTDADRVKNWLWEVGLLWKIIRERRLPGLAG